MWIIPVIWRIEQHGRTCYGGLDLASIQDLTAFVLDFSAEDGTMPSCGYWTHIGPAEARPDDGEGEQHDAT